MKLEHTFTVPVPPEQAWPVLLDVRRIGPCMPGATIGDVDDDTFTGTVKVKVGPITVTYSGRARFLERDEAARQVRIEAKGKETRGSGTANANIVARLQPDGDSTRVDVETDLAITGKPAQFGRGVMADVGGKLIGQFAACLAEELAGSEPAAAAAAPEPEPAASAPTEPTPTVTPDEPTSPTANSGKAHGDPLAAAIPGAPDTGRDETAAPTQAAAAPMPRRTPEAIDLLDAAGAPVAKRLVPVAAVLAGLIALLVLARRRRQ